MGTVSYCFSFGFRYYAMFINDHYLFTWLYPFKTKQDFIPYFYAFSKMRWELIFLTHLSVQSDGDFEFTKSHLTIIFNNYRILYCMSSPYILAQNGRVEHKHRHIANIALSLLFQSLAHLSLWVKALSTTIHIINWLPTPVLQFESHFSSLFGKPPTYSLLCTFYCLCYLFYLRNYATHVLFFKSSFCVFAGMSSSQPHILIVYINFFVHLNKLPRKQKDIFGIHIFSKVHENC